jgi:hypothetical protein
MIVETVDERLVKTGVGGGGPQRQVTDAGGLASLLSVPGDRRRDERGGDHREKSPTADHARRSYQSARTAA